ncbi:hypothetical protein ElyMa_001526200 [Elysia marginata]|uniref:Uncharacterized protein n=1 Tax=Elysia marginata TaxID=1093978 RepID=A0AAV4J719_9GAST|nr:hypothetical protein ElyMa_001526200 [Elysia marginata]
MFHYHFPHLYHHLHFSSSSSSSSLVIININNDIIIVINILYHRWPSGKDTRSEIGRISRTKPPPGLEPPEEPLDPPNSMLSSGLPLKLRRGLPLELDPSSRELSSDPKPNASDKPASFF